MPRTTAEVVAEVEGEMRRDPTGWSNQSSVDDIRADRAGRLARASGPRCEIVLLGEG